MKWEPGRNGRQRTTLHVPIRISRNYWERLKRVARRRKVPVRELLANHLLLATWELMQADDAAERITRATCCAFGRRFVGWHEQAGLWCVGDAEPITGGQCPGCGAVLPNPGGSEQLPAIDRKSAAAGQR